MFAWNIGEKWDEEKILKNMETCDDLRKKQLASILLPSYFARPAEPRGVCSVGEKVTSSPSYTMLLADGVSIAFAAPESGLGNYLLTTPPNCPKEEPSPCWALPTLPLLHRAILGLCPS